MNTTRIVDGWVIHLRRANDCLPWEVASCYRPLNRFPQAILYGALLEVVLHDRVFMSQTFQSPEDAVTNLSTLLRYEVMQGHLRYQ
jgi:hypothetical protein